MRVLLFGGTGQVGGLVLGALRAHEVRAPRRAEVDILDRAAVEGAVRGFDPQAVVHAAGHADADWCEDHPGETYSLNCDGSRNVAEAARGRALVHFSTDHIFDGKAGPYSEEDAPNPLSVYGRTKLESERGVRAVHPGALVVRTSIVWFPDPGGRNFFQRLLEAKEPLPCWKDHWGSYTYGPNLAEAVVELIETGRTGTWNVVGPGTLNRHEFALQVARRFGLDPMRYRAVSIHDAPPRAPRALRAGLRVEKAQGVLRTKLLPAGEALEIAYRGHGRS